MSKERAMSIANLDERTRQAIRELQDTIAAHYPAASFVLTRSPEDPTTLHLLVVSDVDDPDEVGDLVVQRVVALQAEEDIPLHVIPLHTPERIQIALDAELHGMAPRPIRSVRLLDAPV
jgi:hypothetical protein